MNWLKSLWNLLRRGEAPQGATEELTRQVGAPPLTLAFNGRAIDLARLELYVEFHDDGTVTVEVHPQEGRACRKVARGEDAAYLRWALAGIVDDSCLSPKIAAAA